MDLDAPQPGKADDKDWTWVLDRACGECGANVGSLTLQEVAVLNRRCAEGWQEVLGRDRDWVHARPEPDTWSPLEYGCHVRDVFALFLERLELMLNHDDPMFANWDPNVTAGADRYDLQDPSVVARELVAAAHSLAARFESLSAHEQVRPGRRSDGASFTVESFARYEIHDPLHHLWDVTGTPMAHWTP
ncbi:MAG: DinB family protein [Acidimicrobiales bacterium]